MRSIPLFPLHERVRCCVSSLCDAQGGPPQSSQHKPPQASSQPTKSQHNNPQIRPMSFRSIEANSFIYRWCSYHRQPTRAVCGRLRDLWDTPQILRANHSMCTKLWSASAMQFLSVDSIRRRVMKFGSFGDHWPIRVLRLLCRFCGLVAPTVVLCLCEIVWWTLDACE